MSDIAPSTPTTRVIFGPGRARTGLIDEIDRLGGARIMVIATEREHARSADILAPLAARTAATFTGVRRHVPIEIAETARAIADEADVDLLLAIGGGSTIGMAKAIALTSGRPILAVPTTYAGSEVTPVWGLTEGGQKVTGVDPRVLPRTVVYDPELTMSLPLGESMVSGVNALAHCVDAFWAPRFDASIEPIAVEGIRTLAGGLRALHADQRDPTAREATLRGAMIAGQVFARAGSGLHHKICHVLGGRYDLPHAETHAVILPHVLAFNAPAAPEAAAHIAEALSAEPVGAVSEKVGKTGLGYADATQALVDLARTLGVPESLSALGFEHAQISAAAEAILPSVPPENPRLVRHVDLVEILTAAYHGVVAGVSR